VTEWPEFKEPDFEMIKKTLLQAIMFDGRNIYDPKLLASHGIQYTGMGTAPRYSSAIA